MAGQIGVCNAAICSGELKADMIVRNKGERKVIRINPAKEVMSREGQIFWKRILFIA
jgi:hypothetical protein